MDTCNINWLIDSYKEIKESLQTANAYGEELYLCWLIEDTNPDLLEDFRERLSKIDTTYPYLWQLTQEFHGLADDETPQVLLEDGCSFWWHDDFGAREKFLNRIVESLEEIFI